jgi:hypothetical protein
MALFRFYASIFCVPCGFMREQKADELEIVQAAVDDWTEEHGEHRPVHFSIECGEAGYADSLS